MSASQTWFGDAAVNCRASRLGASGKAWLLSVVVRNRRRHRARMPCRPHQAGDPVTPHPAALGPERGMHAGAAIAAPAVGMDAADGVDQRRPVAAGTGAFGPA